MVKTIKIDKDTNLTLSNNAGWTMEYRSQFGHDIVPDILPVLSAVLQLFSGVENVADVKNALKLLKGGTLTDSLIELTSAQFTDFINVVWAMAKCADDTIDEPRVWIRQFETFPLDVIAPEVVTLILKGFTSSKNFKSLQMAVKAE